MGKWVGSVVDIWEWRGWDREFGALGVGSLNGLWEGLL